MARTKEEYLIENGRLANPVNGEMWIVHSSPKEGVKKFKLPVWEISECGHIIDSDGGPNIQLLKYSFNQLPYSINKATDKTVGEEHGYGSGFGDLWAWSYFGTFDEAEADILVIQETKRVNEYKKKTSKYLPASA